MQSLEQRLRTSYLFSANAPFIEELYEQYLEDPVAVPAEWRTYFDSLQNGQTRLADLQDVIHSSVVQSIRESSRNRQTTTGFLPGAEAVNPKQSSITRLVNAYRQLGHLQANLNPLQLSETPEVPDLDPYYQGFLKEDLKQTFKITTIKGLENATLQEVISILKDTYTRHIAAEFLYLRNNQRRLWIQHRLEESRGTPSFSPDEKKDILYQLTAAEGMERYLHTKYAGQKRFSLEGGESLIPMLDAMIDRCSHHDVREVVIGMAHRGRLNVLINILGKRPRDIFDDFEGKTSALHPDRQSGDVKYHQGFSADVVLPKGNLHLALCFNPSHLEAVNTVVEGSVRARQDRRADWKRERVIPVLIHGDAAIAGQGVVYETINLGQTRGFSTGGTIHIVINNQIGFTTSNPMDTRSTLYCTDIGKVVQAPIFHVNGDDPEAVAYVMNMAIDYRMAFGTDVFIDMVCYRRHGHNEADEPSATQPLMYSAIREHMTTRELYAAQLMREGVVTQEEVDGMMEKYRSTLDHGESASFYKDSGKKSRYIIDWSVYLNRKWTEPAETGIPGELLQRLGHEITAVPENYSLHPRVERIVRDRVKMVAGGLPIDWGCAENLAYASLIHQGYAVRLTGQDSGRGTFFHRHAVLHDQHTGESHIPLQHLFEGQPWFSVVDSILSEMAVLGYEYGYTSTNPNSLVIWEAQFGDFANGAQVLIDQFITSSEEKWGRLSGLVMMLPHGWEGQGPEHSSARLERFLQLSAHDNIQVVYPTTPAQMFHLLRRQMVRAYRKPLIIMTPKSTLRRKISFSNIEDLTHGRFRNVIGEIDELDPDAVKRIVLCTGKIYYDLLERRREKGQTDVALVRIEQLHPFPFKALNRALHRYPKATQLIWCQEEPMNQGAWYQIQPHLRASKEEHHRLGYAGRLASAAPAGGSYGRHMERQKRLVEAALNTQTDNPVPILVKSSGQPEPFI